MDYESITPDDDARTLTIVLKQAKADLRKDLAYPVFVILDVSEVMTWQRTQSVQVLML